MPYSYYKIHQKNVVIILSHLLLSLLHFFLFPHESTVALEREKCSSEAGIIL